MGTLRCAVESRCQFWFEYPSAYKRTNQVDPVEPRKDLRHLKLSFDTQRHISLETSWRETRRLAEEHCCSTPPSQLRLQACIRGRLSESVGGGAIGNPGKGMVANQNSRINLIPIDDFYKKRSNCIANKGKLATIRGYFTYSTYLATNNELGLHLRLTQPIISSGIWPPSEPIYLMGRHPIPITG
jgi:hypothetical protein